MTAHARPIGRDIATAAVATLLWGAAGCASDSNSAETPPDDPTDAPSTSADRSATSDADQVTDAEASAEPRDAGSSEVSESDDVSLDTTLNEGEIADLLWMREEEQLAHDVYLAMHEQWGLRIFENIGASEATHIEAALGVMDAHRIDDPAAGNRTGTFTEPALQELYDELVDRGNASLVDALEVGAFVEELDIDDLRTRSAATETTALIDLYARLEKGSRNHLRAFTSQLDGRDGAYVPTVLDLDAFDEIVSSPMERGHDA